MERDPRERTGPDPRERLKRRLIVGGIALLAFNAFLFAVLSSDTDPPDEVAQPGVERIVPADGANILPQSDIGIDLDDNHEADITLDGELLPNNEMSVRDSGRGVFVYTPGAGRTFERWPIGVHQVQACFWENTAPQRPADAPCVSWSVKVG